MSNANGHIEITATNDEKAQRFKLTWTETGGPPVQKPTRRSFGTRLINRIADELRGQVRLSFPTEGLVCEFSIPIAYPRAPSTN